MKKIVLVSSGQPSINPRLVKEANALAENGFDVIVIYSFWTNWALKADMEIFKNILWNPMLEGGSPTQNNGLYIFTRLRFKLANFLAQHFTFKYGIAELAKGRAYTEMLAKAISIKADLYIAHNLAALPIAAKAAKKHNAKYGFDAEDYHRQEISDDPYSFSFRISKFLEDRYLPKSDYITAASPLIGAEYKKLYPSLNPIVINNVFSLKYIQKPVGKSNSPLKLFWFSQTIGRGRGIEEVIQALGSIDDKSIILTLLGNLSDSDRQYFKDLTFNIGLYPEQLRFLDPVDPDSIFAIASAHDIGLALEKRKPFNRDICLTNKLFTYITSGLAIIATETVSQKKFIDEYKKIGKTYESGNIQRLSEIIKDYLYDKEILIETQNESLKTGLDNFNWEHERIKFTNLIKSIL